MISVVAPNLNEERNLPRFLESLKQQTFKDLEVIIVDGNSNDNSKQIIRDYRDNKGLNIILIHYAVKNFGKIRNLGHYFSNGTIVLQCNTDNYFPPNFLEKLHSIYQNSNFVSVTGRVYPSGTSWIALFAYPAFDLLRWLSVKCKKYRPSGSFLSYRRKAFEKAGGFPEVTVNEDGLLGQKLERVGRCCFRLDMFVGHHVKKFEDWGGVKALLFYLYVLRNHFPMLTPFLEPVERKAGRVFSHTAKRKKV